MCDGSVSSLYASIWDNKKQIVKNLSDNLEYWEYLQSDIRQKIQNRGEVYRITVMGGEGTIQKDLYKLANWLIDEKLSDQVHLQIGTNGAVFLDEVFDRWCKNFRHLSFAISVDSTNADNFSYVRYPVKFAKISKNLQSFKVVDLAVEPTPNKNVFFSVNLLSPPMALPKILNINSLSSSFG
jgi:hypothetical protein